MTPKWIERVTGPLEQKKQYRQYKARIAALPPTYRTAAEGLTRYLTYRGGITRGDILVTMLVDLTDLLEQAAADGTPIRGVVGDDPVDFVETFLRNYAEGEWINKERARLTSTIDRAVEQEGR